MTQQGHGLQFPNGRLILISGGFDFDFLVG
jgi:hypothetical protein